MSEIDILTISPKLFKAFINEYKADNICRFATYCQLWLYSYSSSGVLTIDDTSYNLKQGMLFCVLPGKNVAVKADKRPVSLANICFNFMMDLKSKYEFSSAEDFNHNVETERDICFQEFNSFPEVITFQNYSDLEELFSKLCTAEYYMQPYKSLAAKGCFFQIMDIVYKQILAGDDKVKQKENLTPYTHRQTISKAISFMEHFIGKSNVTLAEIAEAAGSYNPVYFGCIFKNATGKSPIEFLLEKRIEKAKLMLKMNWSLRISEVGYECGFENSKYFLKVFKKHTGKTPKQFRLET